MTIISGEKRFIIVQIPKTGCTTTQYYFGTHKLARVLWGVDKATGLDLAHLTCAEIIPFLPPPDLPTDYKWHTFVRNPYDRAYSAYNAGLRPAVKRQISFQAFLEAILENPTKYGIHALPMTHFVTPDDLQTHHIRVFHTETFDQDLNILLQAHDLTVLPRSNKNVQNMSFKSQFRYKHIYNANPKCIDLVNAIYKKDFETFGYSCIEP